MCDSYELSSWKATARAAFDQRATLQEAIYRIGREMDRDTDDAWSILQEIAGILDDVLGPGVQD